MRGKGMELGALSGCLRPDSLLKERIYTKDYYGYDPRQGCIGAVPRRPQEYVIRRPGPEKARVPISYVGEKPSNSEVFTKYKSGITPNPTPIFAFLPSTLSCRIQRIQTL